MKRPEVGDLVFVAHPAAPVGMTKAEVVAVGPEFAAVRGWGLMALATWVLEDSGYQVYPSREAHEDAARLALAWSSLRTSVQGVRPPKHLSAEQIEQVVKLIKGER